ncbi:MAG: hypothetical protein K2Y51_17980 [Gammaproteobacteria bacterium]|nr:hypothetical protein [Gammaproteobacteria bacterium]
MPSVAKDVPHAASTARGAALALLLTALPLAAHASAAAAVRGAPATARVMLEFALPPADAAGFGQRFGLRLLRHHPVSRLYVYEVQAGRDPAAVIARLAVDPAVATVEFDQALHTEGTP